MNNRASIDPLQFLVDIERQNNKLRALQSKRQFEELPELFNTSDIIRAILIFFVLSCCTIGLGIIILRFLMPTGYELWKEETENHHSKTQ